MIFSDELSFDERMVNMVCLVGTGSLILAAIARVFMGAPPELNALMLTFCFIGLFFIYLTNRFQLYNVVLWVLLIVICDILLPMSFFLVGGADSGLAAFVVMSSTCILLLSKGKPRVIMVTVHVLLMVGCYLFAVYQPIWVLPVYYGNPLFQALDNIQSFAVSILFVGTTILFQRSMYAQEKSKVEEAKAEIERERLVSLALFDESPHINVLFDDQFRLIGLNPAALKFAEGVATESELKQHLPEIIAEATPLVQPNGRPSATLTIWLERTKREGQVSFETALMLRGSEHNVSVVMKRIPYGESFAIVAYLVDNSEFYAMQREALLGARAKSEFLANMSHEIRTPLNAVISMEAIGRAATDIGRKDYAFDQIGEAAEHLLGIINDILDMSKIEANKLTLNKHAFNVEDVLRRVARVISFKTSEKHQQFIVDIDERVPVGLVTDDLRLTQVMNNLLSNAVKFTPEGGSITVSVKMLEQKNELCTVQFSVSDTGIGIPKENLNRIFNSFEQVETNTSRKFGGTGLGLSISEKFVNMMGGDLSVTSVPGEGSTFSFTVRAQPTEEAPNTLLSPEVNLREIRCLIVGSEDSSFDACRAVSRRIGISCDYAQGGAQAQEMLAEKRYDICFLDWRSDNEGSVELAHHIKKTGAVAHVVMSAYPFEIAEAAGKVGEESIDHYLTKPLFRSDYINLLNELYGSAVVEEPPTSSETSMDFTGIRILLAEDLDINQEIVCALFEPLGFEIAWAKNGREALDMYEDDPSQYDLILMDMQMPEMDGLEATRRIRALKDFRARRVPIIALTANVFKEDVDNSLAAGMNDHLGKPLDFDEAIRKISFHLRARQT
ncbi:MAG: response regulator [Coriobacteriales bacterium]|jgi:signal transduction histidine kinase/DNA-binding response OmpR family regulator|nr:response regulator [Coriobacteriales bacterium]